MGERGSSLGLGCLLFRVHHDGLKLSVYHFVQLL